MAILKTSTVHGNLTVTGVINGITAGGSGGTIDKLTSPVTINITGGATGSVSTDFSISPININITSLDASKLSGTITATKLATARTIGLSGVTATAQSFDGSANITIPITEIPGSLLTGSTTINTTGSAGFISGTQNGVTTTISAENSSYTYYRSTSSDGHWFNKDVVINGSIYPSRETSGNRNLGLSNSKWDNIYATTFNGNLVGNVTGSIIGNVTGDISGNATTASKPMYTSIPNLATESLANYVTAGHYMCITNSVINVTDIPTGINSSFLLIVDETTIDSLKVISQVIISNGKMYFRVSPVNSTTWPTWKSLIPDEASSTVSGIVTTGEQTFGGTKHFPSGISSYGIGFTDIPSTAGNGGYIDFHFNGSSDDYTSRIIEDSSGQLKIIGALNIVGGDGIATTKLVASGNIGCSNLSCNDFNIIDSTSPTAIPGKLNVGSHIKLWSRSGAYGGYLDFFYGSATNYTCRIYESAANELNLTSNTLKISGNVIPSVDSTVTLGNISNKFSEGYIDHVIGYADAAASPTYMPIPENADLNIYQTKGYYVCGGDTLAATIVNSPTGGYSFSMKVIDTVSENSTGYKMQIVYQYNTGDIYKRIFDYGGGSAVSSNWTAWKKLATMDDIPTVADTSIVKEKVQNLGTVSGNVSININNGQVVYAKLTNPDGVQPNISIQSFTDTPAMARTVTLILAMDATVQSIVWGGSILWSGGNAPEISGTATTLIVTLLSINNGDYWYAITADGYSYR